jgi:hypothetical protein
MARMIGMLLIIAGLIGLAWGGFTYTKERHNVDLGPIDFQVTEKKTVPIPPIAGAVAVVAGILLVATERRRLAT